MCRGPCRGSGQGKILSFSRSRPGSPHKAQGSAFTLARVLATLVRGGSPLTRMNALPCQGRVYPCQGEFILVKGVLRFSLVQEKFSLVKGKHSSLSRKTVHPDKGGHRPGCGGISLSLTRPGGTVSLLVPGRGYLPPSARACRNHAGYGSLVRPLQPLHNNLTRYSTFAPYNRYTSLLSHPVVIQLPLKQDS